MNVAPWIQTFTGRAVDLVDPRSDQMHLLDISIALGRLPRFNGHTEGARVFSVACHSLLVADLLPRDSTPRLRLIALLHDAHEFATGDISSPMKTALRAFGGPFDSLLIIQQRLQSCIHLAAGLGEIGEDEADAVKQADLLALALEARDLMPEPHPRPWGVPFPPIPGDAPELDILDANAAGYVFSASVRSCIRSAGLTPLPSFGA